MVAGKRVLIVDDEPDIREGVADLLQVELGVEALLAGSGPAALSLLAQAPVHLVVTDFRMPGMNGCELVRSIHQTHPGLPCLMISAYGADVLGEPDCQGAAITGFVDKPLDPDRVVNVVAIALGAGKH